MFVGGRLCSSRPRILASGALFVVVSSVLYAGVGRTVSGVTREEAKHKGQPIDDIAVTIVRADNDCSLKTTYTGKDDKGSGKYRAEELDSSVDVVPCFADRRDPIQYMPETGKVISAYDKPEVEQNAVLHRSDNTKRSPDQVSVAFFTRCLYGLNGFRENQKELGTVIGSYEKLEAQTLDVLVFVADKAPEKRSVDMKKILGLFKDRKLTKGVLEKYNSKEYMTDWDTLDRERE